MRVTTNLIATARIINNTECVAPSLANQLADAMEKTGGNIQPLMVKNVGTIMQPSYELIQPDSMKQLAILAAVRVLKERDGKQYGNCNAIISNPTNNDGDQLDFEAAILAQL